MTAEIACYVPGLKVAGHDYKNDSFDTRLWTGLCMVKDALERAGHEVDFCSAATVSRYRLVFASLTSDRSVWGFWRERALWEPGEYKVAVGGFGVLNPKVLLGLCDFIQLGRGEATSVELAEAVLKGHSLHGESVIHAPDYDPGEEYRLAQTSEPYPHEVVQAVRVYKEGHIGCNHKCAFCGYSWHRVHVGGEFRNDFGENRVEQERAMRDLKASGWDDLRHLRVTAIDGTSERLRYLVNKRIPDADVEELLARLCDHGGGNVKLFNVVGYPTETLADWRDLVEVFGRAEARSEPRETRFGIGLHNTPFRAFPLTPMACSPMAYRDFRGMFGAMAPRLPGKQFFKGEALFGTEDFGCDSLPATAMSCMVWRGDERTADAIRRLALHGRFWGADSRTKLATIESVCDVRKMFEAKDPAELPTANIRTYAKVEKLYDRYRWLPPATTGARRRPSSWFTTASLSRPAASWSGARLARASR